MVRIKHHPPRTVGEEDVRNAPRAELVDEVDTRLLSHLFIEIVRSSGHGRQRGGQRAKRQGLNPQPQGQSPPIPENATDEDIETVIWEQLKTCYDPEIPVDIVNLGLIYRCEVTSLGNGQRSVSVDMTLTAPGCGMGDVLVQDAREKIAIIPTVSDVIVDLVFDPPWNVGMMSDEARLQTGLM